MLLVAVPRKVQLQRCPYMGTTPAPHSLNHRTCMHDHAHNPIHIVQWLQTHSEACVPTRCQCVCITLQQSLHTRYMARACWCTVRVSTLATNEFITLGLQFAITAFSSSIKCKTTQRAIPTKIACAISRQSQEPFPEWRCQSQ